MSLTTKIVANIAAEGANFAKAIGLTDSAVIRKCGVVVMESVVPSEVVTVEIRDGITMEVNPTEDGRWYYFADVNRRWGSPQDFTFSSVINQDDTVLDVGAHVGYFSLISRDEVGKGGRVISFEPLPANYQRLQNNIERNEYKNIIPEQLAVGDTVGETTIYDADKTIRATTVSGIGTGQGIRVKTTTLDQYCDSHNIEPDVIKINAEGGEYEAINGMTEILKNQLPRMVIELHPNHLEEKGTSAIDLLEFLGKKGYVFEWDNVTMSPKRAQRKASKATDPFSVVAWPD